MSMRRASFSSAPPTSDCHKAPWRWQRATIPTSWPSSKSLASRQTRPPRASGMTAPPNSAPRRPASDCAGLARGSRDRPLPGSATLVLLARGFGEPNCLLCLWGFAGLGGAPPQEGDELTNDAAPKDEDGHDEDCALDPQHPLAEARKVVLHIDDDGGADGGTKNGPHAADERHQHHLSRHL